MAVLPAFGQRRTPLGSLTGLAAGPIRRGPPMEEPLVEETIPTRPAGASMGELTDFIRRVTPDAPALPPPPPGAPFARTGAIPYGMEAAGRVDGPLALRPAGTVDSTPIPGIDIPHPNPRFMGAGAAERYPGGVAIPPSPDVSAPSSDAPPGLQSLLSTALGGRDGAVPSIDEFMRRSLGVTARNGWGAPTMAESPYRTWVDSPSGGYWGLDPNAVRGASSAYTALTNGLMAGPEGPSQAAARMLAGDLGRDRLGLERENLGLDRERLGVEQAFRMGDLDVRRAGVDAENRRTDAQFGPGAISRNEGAARRDAVDRAMGSWLSSPEGQSATPAEAQARRRLFESSLGGPPGVSGISSLVAPGSAPIGPSAEAALLSALGMGSATPEGPTNVTRHLADAVRRGGGTVNERGQIERLPTTAEGVNRILTDLVNTLPDSALSPGNINRTMEMITSTLGADPFRRWQEARFARDNWIENTFSRLPSHSSPHNQALIRLRNAINRARPGSVSTTSVPTGGDTFGRGLTTLWQRLAGD